MAGSMTGSALREKGYYKIGDRSFVAVSTALNLFDKDATMAHNAWLASLVERLVIEAKEKRKHKRWVWVSPDDSDKGYWAMEEVDPRDCLLDKKYIAGEGFRQMRVAAERGNVAHTFAEEWAGGGGCSPCSLEDLPHWVENTVATNKYRVDPDVVLPYIESQLHWLEEFNPEILVSEHTVYHEKLGYAGTMDGIMKIGKHLFHFDWKTSSSTYERHLIQAAAYRHATHIIKEDGEHIPNIRTLGAGIIHIKPQGCVWRHRPVTGPSFNDFKRILSLYRGKEDGRNALKTNQELSLHKRQMDKLRAKTIGDVFDKPEEAPVQVRYWLHPESCALYQSGPEPDEFTFLNCKEVTKEKYIELGGVE
jgi:hypothetical protein